MLDHVLLEALSSKMLRSIIINSFSSSVPVLTSSSLKR